MKDGDQEVEEDLMDTSFASKFSVDSHGLYLPEIFGWPC